MEGKGRFVYGLRGLADMLQISKGRALILTKGGKLDEATIMRGKRKRMYDVEKVLKLLTLSHCKTEGAENGN